MHKIYALLISFLYIPCTFLAHSSEHFIAPAAYALLSENLLRQGEEGFAAGTKIKTPNGYTYIENLRKGDCVLCYDSVCASYIPKIVLHASQRNVSQYVQIIIGGEKVLAACHQKFYVPAQNKWVRAQEISIYDNLSPYSVPIEDVEHVQGPITVYALTVEDHIFYIEPFDIQVHNANIVATCAPLIAQIGQIILRDPVIAILGTAIFLPNNSPTDVSSTSHSPEKVAFERQRGELYRLLDDLLKTKQDIDRLFGRCAPQHQPNLPPAHPLDTNLRVTSAQEAAYNETQKAQLRLLRQTELNTIEQRVREAQTSLCLYFHQLVEARSDVQAELLEFLHIVDQDIAQWNAHLADLQFNIAVPSHGITCQAEDLLYELEAKNKELKVVIEYCKNAQHAINLKKMTNLVDCMQQEEKNVIATEKIINEKRVHIIRDLRTGERYFRQRSVDLVNLKKNIRKKNAQQRQEKKAKRLAEASKKKSSDKPPEDPKKDDEKKDENNKLITFFEQNIKHIFNKEEGHLPDTLESRNLILGLVSNIKNFVNIDRHGNKWYGKILSNGQQLWATVRNNVIRNCGINKIEKPFHPETGFCRPDRPVRNICKKN